MSFTHAVRNTISAAFSHYSLVPHLFSRSSARQRTTVALGVGSSRVPHMRERGSGTIINVTSSVTFGAKPLTSVYCASKFAVDGLLEARYFELAPFGIRVKMVEPGHGPPTPWPPRTATYHINHIWKP